MQSKIVCLAVLAAALLINVFNAPHVNAFFDYNKFHPMPFRPDLQEFCPQVSDQQTVDIQKKSCTISWKK